MPRCEVPAEVVDDSAFGFWLSEWGSPLHEIACDRSADGILVTRWSASTPWSGGRRGSGKIRACSEHAKDMVAHRMDGERMRWFPATDRGRAAFDVKPGALIGADRG